jgi:hypothetical protein
LARKDGQVAIAKMLGPMRVKAGEDVAQLRTL